MNEANELTALVAARKTGDEPFTAAGAPLGFDLLSFWQWAASDLTNNTLRGVLAEYIVARALCAPAATDGIRTEWDRYDLRAAGSAIEVKSAAYLQTWFQRLPSEISFDIGPKRGWDATTNVTGSVPARAADVYVFALLHHQHKPTLNPLNADQWTYYVLAKSVLDRRVPRQKRIRLGRLLKLGAVPTPYVDLNRAVEVCARG